MKFDVSTTNLIVKKKKEEDSNQDGLTLEVMAKIKMIKGQSFIFKKDIFAPKMKIFFFFF